VGGHFGCRGKGQQLLCPCSSVYEDRDRSGLGALDRLRFFRMDSPCISTRWHCGLNDRGSVSGAGISDLLVPARDRQLGSENGRASLEAILADFQTSRRSLSFSGAMAKSAITRTSIRLSRAKRWRKLPSARAKARRRIVGLQNQGSAPGWHSDSTFPVGKPLLQFPSS
jgi:hypothetical protein